MPVCLDRLACVLAVTQSCLSAMSCRCHDWFLQPVVFMTSDVLCSRHPFPPRYITSGGCHLNGPVIHVSSLAYEHDNDRISLVIHDRKALFPLANTGHVTPCFVYLYTYICMYTIYAFGILPHISVWEWILPAVLFIVLVPVVQGIDHSPLSFT